MSRSLGSHGAKPPDAAAFSLALASRYTSYTVFCEARNVPAISTWGPVVSAPFKTLPDLPDKVCTLQNPPTESVHSKWACAADCTADHRLCDDKQLQVPPWTAAAYLAPPARAAPSGRVKWTIPTDFLSGDTLSGFGGGDMSENTCVHACARRI